MVFGRSPEEKAIKFNREQSRRAVIEGRAAIRRGDFQAAEEHRRNAVAYEAHAIRAERIRDIKKRGSLYQPALQQPAHIRRAERMR